MTWIQTYTGIAFDLSDPRPEMIAIEDIARALSQLNRYTGHTAYPYSVGQHCVLMSEQVAGEHALWALLHDAAEAYVGDMARPLKGMLSGYGVIEDAVMEAILEALDIRISYASSRAIRTADLRMLVTERQQLMGPVPASWGIDAEPYPIAIEPWASWHAEEMWAGRYVALAEPVRQ